MTAERTVYLTWLLQRTLWSSVPLLLAGVQRQDTNVYSVRCLFAYRPSLWPPSWLKWSSHVRAIENTWISSSWIKTFQSPVCLDRLIRLRWRLGVLSHLDRCGVSNNKEHSQWKHSFLFWTYENVQEHVLAGFRRLPSNDCDHSLPISKRGVCIFFLLTA